MKESQIKAMITLLDDEDPEVKAEIFKQFELLGDKAIPFLEQKWENTLDVNLQNRIEDLIHSLQYKQLKERLIEWKANESEDLLKGMWLIATYQYPDLSFESISAKIDQLYFDAWSNFKEDLQPMDQVRLLNFVMFNKFKFSANTKNFHASSNSMINQVLESKKGNPISLCVIYLLIAQRLNLPVHGVNLPNLFILIYLEEDFSFYINAFNKGLIFSKEDIANYIEQLKLEPSDVYYDPCDNISIIQRVLRNLIVSFRKTGDLDKCEELDALLDSIT
jgi:regulator of sirC expression with transglutaminase-like and TPR domain